MIYTHFRKRCVIVNFPKNFVKDSDDFVRYLIKCSKLFGLVKYTRKRHREIDAYTLKFGLYLLKLTQMSIAVPLVRGLFKTKIAVSYCDAQLLETLRVAGSG